MLWSATVHALSGRMFAVEGGFSKWIWVGREARKEGVTTSGSGWAGGEGRKEGVIASGSGWEGSEGRWIQQADLGGWE